MSLTIAIPESDFRKVLTVLTDAASPKVDYNADQFEMLEDAYDVRGDAIDEALKVLKQYDNIF